MNKDWTTDSFDNVSVPFISSIFMKDESGNNEDPTVDLPYGSPERYIQFMVSHVCFFMLNFVNLSWLLVFEGYVFKNLQKNKFLQLMVGAAAVQITSCISSIQRYNIVYEYNWMAVYGSVAGAIAWAFCGHAASYTFQLGGLPKVTKYAILIWWAYATVVSLLTYFQWDEKHFNSFRPMVVVATVYLTGCEFYCLRSVEKKTVSIDPSILDEESFKRLLKALMGINILALALAMPAWPLLRYPQTGWAYCSTLVLAKYLGHMKPVNPAQGEGSSLLP